MKLLLTILISLPLLTDSIHLRSHLHPMTPEFTKQITILNATEQKVRDKIKTIEGDLTLKKDHLKTLEQQVRDQITTNNQIQHWLSKAQISISTIEKAKESVQIKYDLQRLKPFVALAEKRKDNAAAATRGRTREARKAGRRTGGCRPVRPSQRGARQRAAYGGSSRKI